jgi:diacylglycerol kinase (ATP)
MHLQGTCLLRPSNTGASTSVLAVVSCFCPAYSVRGGMVQKPAIAPAAITAISSRVAIAARHRMPLVSGPLRKGFGQRPPITMYRKTQAASIAMARRGSMSRTALLPRPQTTRVLLRSFGYAFEGVAYILRTQRNARIELAAGLVAVALALWLGLAPLEWAVLAITIAIVLALEWINTALELAVSLVSPERHASAKAAKDVAAACVLLGALTSVVVGLLLFVPRLVARLPGT